LVQTGVRFKPPEDCVEVSRDGVGVPYHWSRAMVGCGTSVALALSSTAQRQKSAFITVLRSAFNQEADVAWHRAPSSSRSIEGLY